MKIISHTVFLTILLLITYINSHQIKLIQCTNNDDKYIDTQNRMTDCLNLFDKVIQSTNNDNKYIDNQNPMTDSLKSYTFNLFDKADTMINFYVFPFLDILFTLSLICIFSYLCIMCIVCFVKALDTLMKFLNV